MAGQRQLYIYWRLAAPDLPAALPAVHAMQRRLCEAHRELRCELLQRGDDAPGTAQPTLMEVYRTDTNAGVDAALQAEIEAAAAGALARYLQGTRHVEVFEPR